MKPTNTNMQSFCSRHAALLLAGSALMLAAFTTSAQIDPAERQILHLGVDASLTDQGPLGAYAFYYWNMPNVPTTNEVLRLAIAPVYVDGDLGFKNLLGENNDLAVGAFGGLYANSYQEVDSGQFYKNQSFDGNSAGLRVSLYHRFNPDGQIPLTGVLRETMNYESFDKTGDTANDFALPSNQPFFTTRAGFRWGGKEPVLGPKLALEVSAWYELEQRTQSGGYGFNNDRQLESTSHRIFGRAEFHYLTLDSKNYIVFGLQGGAAIDSDRLSCFRMGGMLQYTKEFPLTIPGYYQNELSAKDYGLAYGTYAIPIGPDKEWYVLTEGAAALVNYQDGTGQPGAFNSGVGIGPAYSASSGRWKIYTQVGYGFEAERQDGRGGYSFGVAFDYRFGSGKLASDEAYEQLQDAYGSTTSIEK